MLIVSDGTLLGDAGLDLCLAGRIWPLACLEDLAHDHVLHLVGGDVGTLQRRLDRRAAELGGVERGESAAELADRRAGGGKDQCLGHRMWALPVRVEVVKPSDRVIVRRQMKVEATTAAPADVDADTVTWAGTWRTARWKPGRLRSWSPAKPRASPGAWRDPRRRAALAGGRSGPGGGMGTPRRRGWPRRSRSAGRASWAPGRFAGGFPRGDAAEAAGLVEGEVLGAYRFTRYKAAEDEDDDLSRARAAGGQRRGGRGAGGRGRAGRGGRAERRPGLSRTRPQTT